jgi:TolA-binding protein
MAAGLFVFVRPGPAPAQVTADQAADMVLNSARKAYNEKNYPFAVTRFREFLAKYGNHKEVPRARYGLALSLLELPEKDYNAAIEQLQPLAGNKDLAEQPFVIYYLGLAQRGVGTREMAQAAAKPQEAAQRQTAANQRFDEAAKQFAAAMPLFTARVKPPAADAKELPIDLEWAARARCDLAEMQLRTTKVKEAQASAAPFLKDPLSIKSRYRGLGLYYHGFASFLLKDMKTAAQTLSTLTPFNDPVFGTHARYLLARTLHETGDKAEAATHYDNVLADYDKNKKDAAETLKRADALKDDPDERARLDALVKDPPPDHVARAAFFRAVLQYEGGKFPDALVRFTAFAQQYANSPLVPEAQLRQGFCQVHLKQYADAQKTLQPVADKEARLSDQATFWIGKAQIGLADAANAPAYEAALKAAVDTLRKAADKAQQLAGSDLAAKERRGEILLEVADTLQMAKQYGPAATTYAQILGEKLLPPRDEEVLQRQATALHLAADYPGSDQLCIRFQQTYPKSPLLAAIAFRMAENAYFTALAAEKNAALPNRVQELARLNNEAAQRYRVVVDKYPEFPFVNLARYGLAMALYRKGELDKAHDMLKTIPAPERAGELAVVSYALADCLLRMVPARADDAPAVKQVQEKLQAATELLDSFLVAQPAAPQAPDALLKLGFCHQRLAALATQPPDRAKFLGNARSAYERLIQQFPNHDIRPQATLERAKCLALAGDPGGAITELQRFLSDPLNKAPMAPMAVLQLAAWLRGQNKAADAATALAQCRQQHEANLRKDPMRTSWVVLLQYHHGLALQEAGMLTEARGVFDQAVKQAPNTLEAAEAALRWSQCFKEEGTQKIAAARKIQGTPTAKPEELTAAKATLEEGLKMIRDAVPVLEGQINQVKAAQPTWEVRARMLYEAAWEYRLLAEAEVEAVRLQMQQDQLKKLQEEAAKKVPPVLPPAVIQAPEVPRIAIPVQPSEQKARAQYEALVAAFPALPLAGEARLELAELIAERGENDAALKLLGEALTKAPPAELADKIRLRMGACHAAKGDVKNALTQLDAVAKNPQSPLAGQAQYRAGECLMGQKDWANAVLHLAVFRDQGPFQNLPGLTDRALLRLGHATAHTGQWDQSRQAHEQLVGRFNMSPWIHEARYGIGWAWQNQKQYDQAVAAYEQVTANTAAEIAAKAQLQIGLCRLEQKRYPEATAALLVVPFTYDYPEYSAIALCEAARAFQEAKQPDQAVKLWQRVIKDHPQSKWAEVARQRLVGPKKS